MLRLALRHKFLVVVLTAAVIYSTVPIGRMMGISLIPRDDQSEYEVSVTTPEGYSLERTSQLTAELESRIWKLRGTEHVFTTIGQTEGGRVVKGEGDVTRGTIYVRITDLEKRHAAVPLRGWWDLAGHVRRLFARAPFDQFEIQQEARKFLEDYPDLRVSVNDVSPFQGGRRPQTFQVSLAGPDLNQLAAYGDQLIAELKREGGIVDLDTTLSLRKPEVQVVIDREAASDLGVPVGTIADTLRVLVGGLPVSKFREGDEQYDVWLRAESGKRSTSQDLYQITFPSPAVGLVKLASLAKLNEDRGPTEIERLSRERIVTVVGNPEGIALGEAIDSRRADLEGDEPAAPVYLRLHRPGQDAGRDRLLLPGRVRAVDHVHVPDPGRPVRELDAADRDPDGAAGHDSVRDAVAGLVPHADGPLRDVRPVHAGGDRQEKRHPPGRRHQPASGQGAVAARRDHRGQPHASAADPDDHRDAGRRHGPDRAGQRPGAGARASMAKVIIGGQMLSLVLALLVTPVFYCPARHVRQLHAPPGHSLLGRAGAAPAIAPARLMPSLVVTASRSKRRRDGESSALVRSDRKRSHRILTRIRQPDRRLSRSARMECEQPQTTYLRTDPDGVDLAPVQAVRRSTSRAVGIDRVASGGIEWRRSVSILKLCPGLPGSRSWRSFAARSTIVKMGIKHRERMAMIQLGINPDAPTRKPYEPEDAEV